MRISFTSNHLAGAGAEGLLRIGIAIEDTAAGQTRWDEVWFSVPADFHSHNDSVAAALLTLAGEQFDRVGFNFPISAACAARLGRFYGLREIGPVDPALEPRRPGRRVAMLFSGGSDSSALWLLLRRALGGDFLTITNDYSGFFAYEAAGRTQIIADVTCRTNLRERRWDRYGRFNFAVPLLYADYLDLAGVAPGHTIGHHADTYLGSLCLGNPAQWTRLDEVLNAGGLEEYHALRPLTTIGVSRILMQDGQHLIEGALAASERPGNPKRYTKEAVFQAMFQAAGLPLPPYLRDIGSISARHQLGTNADRDHRVLFLLKHGYRGEAGRITFRLDRHDLRPLDGLAQTYLERYSTPIVDLLPLSLRSPVVAALHTYGIVPYDEQDWREIDIVLGVLQRAATQTWARRA